MTDIGVDTQRLSGPLRPGQLIGSRYRLDRVAGAGGMAVVWCAFDERLQRPVAIKVISDALAASPAAVARFAREARTHAGIQHPNLVQVYDYSITGSQPYLVMEYVNGQTLSERLDRGGFSATEVHTLARELLSAIACVHDHGVLHRDIKSGNVLIDAYGRARLTDFGLARLEDASRITRPNEVVGTLRFLAPELIEGKPATRQSDLFAFGVLLRTAATHIEADSQLAKLIDWLTRPEAEARPADAHAALAFLNEPPTEKRRRQSSRSPRATARASTQSPRAARNSARSLRPERREDPTRIMPGRPAARRNSQPATQVRNRVIAVCALLVAIVGTTVIIATAGGGTPRHAVAASSTRRATQGAPRKMSAADRQLQRLAADVRAAARS